MKPLHTKLQGLWVGAALGELYGSGRLNPWVDQDFNLVSQPVLTQSERLLALAAHWLKTSMPHTQDVLQSGDRDSEVLLALLPLIFLHPGSAEGLSESLLNCFGQLKDEQQNRCASAIILVQIMGQLQQTDHLADCIPKLLQRSALKGTAIGTSLQTAQQWLDHRCGLSDLLAAQSRENATQPGQAIAQALYLILSTPQDFRLTVQRGGILWRDQPEWVMLVAALSGFRNGIQSLPLRWRQALRQIHWQGETASLETGLLTLAHLCAVRWTGSYTEPAPTVWSTVAIAPPGQLRPR